jgi:hypothetical protein
MAVPRSLAAAKIGAGCRHPLYQLIRREILTDQRDERKLKTAALKSAKTFNT